MDSLNKAYAQLRDLFLSLTPAARLTTTLLLSVVVISLVYLVGNFGAGGKVTLFAVYTYSDLVAIEKSFGDAGLRDFEISGSRVKVPHNELELYLQAMPLELAMRNPDADYHRVNDSGNVFLPARQIENKQKVAKQGKMRRVLLQFNWIEEASVEYSTTRGTGFPRRDEHSALVAVKAKSKRHIEPGGSPRTTFQRRPRMHPGTYS